MKPSAAKLALPLLLFSALFFGGAPAAAGTDAPANDATFWLEVYIDGRFIGELPVVPKELTPSPDARGVQVIEGKVVGVEGTTDDWDRECSKFNGRTCSTAYTVGGTYGGGEIEITVSYDRTYTHDGSNDIEAGTVETSGSATLSGIYNQQNARFEGEMTWSSQGIEWECAQWGDGDMDGVAGDDVGGICDLDRYVPEAVKTEKYTWMGWIRGDVKDGDGQTSSGGAKSSGDGRQAASETVTMNTSEVSGEVEYKPKGSDTWQPLTPGTVLQEGDTIGTGFESQGRFRVGQREFVVGQLTQLRIDQFLRKENLEKTILYLNVGAIRVKEKHTPAPRGDFHVETPGANSAPRGTEFIVSVAEDGSTTTYVVEGTVAFEDSAGNSVDIKAGSKASAAEGGGIEGPEPYTFGETAFFPTLAGSGGSSMTPVAIIGAVILAALLAGSAVFLRRRRRTLQPA